MKTYIILAVLLFISFAVNGQDQDLKVTAGYISENRVSVKIENLINDTVSMLIAPDMGVPQSGMMLTFIKNKKDTIDHYFYPLYDKYILRIPPHLVHERTFFIGSTQKNTDVDINIYLRYIVHSTPNKRKQVRKQVWLEWNKSPQNKAFKPKIQKTVQD